MSVFELKPTGNVKFRKIIQNLCSVNCNTTIYNTLQTAKWWPLHDTVVRTNIVHRISHLLLYRMKLQVTITINVRCRTENSSWTRVDYVDLRDTLLLTLRLYRGRVGTGTGRAQVAHPERKLRAKQSVKSDWRCMSAGGRRQHRLSTTRHDHSSSATINCPVGVTQYDEKKTLIHKQSDAIRHSPHVLYSCPVVHFSRLAAIQGLAHFYSGKHDTHQYKWL